MSEKLWCISSTDERDILSQEKLDLEFKDIDNWGLSENEYKRLDSINNILTWLCKNETKETLHKFKYWDHIDKFWLEDENVLFIIDWITKYLKNKKLDIDELSDKYREAFPKDWEGFSKDLEIFSKYLKNQSDKEIVFDEEFIYKNMITFIKNINEYLIYLMWIESSWWELNIENKISSAKWPLQIIDWWKDWKKHKKFSRKKGVYTPFEVMLRRTDRFYTGNNIPTFKSDKIPEYIKNAWNNNWKLDLSIISVEKQINLMIIDILMRNWTNMSDAKQYFMWMILWWIWSRDMLYSKIHHTSIDEKTNEKMVEINFKLNNYKT